jgi:acyl transferase domain-containing protein
VECVLPPAGCPGAETFWRLLAGGASAVATVPADRWNGTRFTAADGLGGAARGAVPPYGGGRGRCD